MDTPTTLPPKPEDFYGTQAWADSFAAEVARQEEREYLRALKRVADAFACNKPVEFAVIEGKYRLRLPPQRGFGSRWVRAKQALRFSGLSKAETRVRIAEFLETYDGDK